MRHLASVIAFAAVLSGLGSTVSAQHPSIYTIVSELRQQSRADALTIKDAYRPMIATAMFADREHLRRAIEAGELVALSSLELPHVRPRLFGESPIAQKDLENQPLYVALRPAAMGMLTDIARRVQYGPLEVTSLVRTTEYQRALMRGNGNANTDVPTHAMGYAVDIGLKFAPEETAKDLRRVLEEMRQAGDVYFIAEANQLTLHIVPVPSRMGHFEELYRKAIESAQAPVAEPQPQPALTPVPQEPARQSTLGGVWRWVQSLFD